MSRRSSRRRISRRRSSRRVKVAEVEEVEGSEKVEGPPRERSKNFRGRAVAGPRRDRGARLRYHPRRRVASLCAPCRGGAAPNAVRRQGRAKSSRRRHSIWPGVLGNPGAPSRGQSAAPVAAASPRASRVVARPGQTSSVAAAARRAIPGAAASGRASAEAEESIGRVVARRCGCCAVPVAASRRRRRPLRPVWPWRRRERAGPTQSRADRSLDGPAQHLTSSGGRRGGKRGTAPANATAEPTGPP